jgi:hypothetical protein
MRCSAIRRFPLLFTIAACTSSADSPDLSVAQSAADTAAVIDWDAGFAWAAADPIPLGAPGIGPRTPQDTAGDGTAMAVAAGAPQSFSPPGCVQTKVQGNVVTLLLSGCDGPLGLTQVSGTVKATFSPAMGGAVKIQLSGSSVSVGGSMISVDTQGTLTVGGDPSTRTFQASSTTSGSGPLGTSVFRSGNYTLGWQSGSSCGTIDGDSTLSGSNAATSKTTNYTRCRGMCPQSGTVIQTLSNGGTSVTLTYNATSSPTWQSNGGGNSGSLSIPCP